MEVTQVKRRVKIGGGLVVESLLKSIAERMECGKCMCDGF